MPTLHVFGSKAERDEWVYSSELDEYYALHRQEVDRKTFRKWQGVAEGEHSN